MSTDTKSIKVQLSYVYYPQIAAEAFLKNLENGKFNRTCRKVFDKHVKPTKEDEKSSLFFFASHIHTAYELAWGLLVEGTFYKDWRFETINSEVYLIPPTNPGNGTISYISIPIERWHIMFSLLWVILRRVDFNDENIVFCKNARDIRIAVCYQIRKLQIEKHWDSSFFMELCKSFEIPTSPWCISPMEEKAGVLALDAVVNGNVRYSLSRIRKYTDATYEEIGQAIIRISSDIKSECHWNAITIVLMNIGTFRRFIDEKYPHKEGKAKDKVKKFIVYEIAELINTDREKLYENVRHAAGTYSHVQQQFRSILEEILTT